MSGESFAAPSAAGVRDELQALILGELLGPAGGEQEEVVEARVTERYILGMLGPQRAVRSADEDDVLAVAGETAPDEGEPEPDSVAAPTLFPSSFGLTFCVDGQTTELAVTARWGRYSRERSQAVPGSGDPPLVWRRYSAGGVPVAVPLAEGMIDPIVVDPEQPQVFLRGRIRRAGGEWLVTLFLVNGQEERERLNDEGWLFQAELEVASQDFRSVFLRRASGVEPDPGEPGEEESQILAMLYRDQVEFAAGHGVSVHADVDPDDPARAFRLVTRAVPEYEVPQTVAPSAKEIPALADLVLDMKELSELDAGKLAASLQPLATAYKGWIGQQHERISDPAARLQGFEAVADMALERCEHAAERIQQGIALLENDVTAQVAFCFANRAMWLQRIHALVAQDRLRDAKLTLEEAVAARDVPGNRSWRPFQLAFMLLNLPSLADPTHSERGPSSDGGRVDLLWFPTGGGKTEAYLGLTAFALAIRRLQGTVGDHDGRDGVGVMMRYTLRLLTIQQFQRAAALMCACEVIRREAASKGDTRWGDTPFRIGLWVGARATPNTTEEADDWLRQVRGATGYAGTRGGSPYQLTYCPWCGERIDPKHHLRVDLAPRRTYSFCGDKYGRCPFSERQAPAEGLPAVVVDEEIYRLLPGLLVGTVDKFAQMPWKGPVQTLFGRVAGRCERHGFRSPDLDDSDSHPRKNGHPAAKTVPAGPLRPPDLIIQDELHLIAGPLGSMVGLYETAVDALATWEVDGKKVRPKVIASTATVRRAPQQAHALFWRGLEVFPPQGLDASDSFFARQVAPSDKTPGRRYLGICAHGRQFKNVLIRVFVAEMAAAQYLFADKGYGTAVDPYMTLVGYFNSLRDLGGMRRHVDDDVSSRLGRIDRRGLARRPKPNVAELTSRMGSSDIPRVLEQLGIQFVPDRPKDSDMPVDVLLATNMISVGIDIPRLGAMVVGGQPKTTAEYIQATSRIGRQSPGLVLTVFGWARPRDLSHYERFEHYHATFYKQVEALSVTPFAPRALDRGLTAMLVSLLRLDGLDWNPDRAAQVVDTKSVRAQQAVSVVETRGEGVSSRPEVGELVRQGMQLRLDQWAGEQAVPNRKLAFREIRDGVTVGLMRTPGLGAWDEWTCLTSLRDVEPGVNLLLTETTLGESEAPVYEFESPKKAQVGGDLASSAGSEDQPAGGDA